jgi:hypothetical protein
MYSMTEWPSIYSHQNLLGIEMRHARTPQTMLSRSNEMSRLH